MRVYQYLLRTFAALKQPHNVRKAVLCRAVLLLAAGDPVAADKEFQYALDVEGFPSSNEAEAIENLVDAFKRGNGELWQRTIAKNASITYADRAVAALLRTLPVPGEAGADDDFAEALGEQPAAGGASGGKVKSAGDRGLRSADAVGATQAATAAPSLGGAAQGDSGVIVLPDGTKLRRVAVGGLGRELGGAAQEAAVARDGLGAAEDSAVSKAREDRARVERDALFALDGAIRGEEAHAGGTEELEGALEG